LLLRQQPPEVEKALEALDKAENLLEGVGTDIDRAYCYTERARAFFLLGTFSGAREAAASALARLGSTPRPESATVLALLGQIALAEGDPRGALQATVEAAQMLHDTGTGREAAELWRELAETFAATGESVRAMEAFRRMAELLGVQAGPVLPQQPATIVLTDAEQVRR
jgi:tetratricopeptide (TPR) repeat protein